MAGIPDDKPCWLRERLEVRRARFAEAELAAMSDADLRDIGIHRGDIHNAVRFGPAADRGEGGSECTSMGCALEWH